MNHIIRGTFAAALLSLIGGGANAAVELQQNIHDALPSGSYADTFYNGGWAGNSYTSGPLVNNVQYGPGPDLGFTFSANANVQSGGTNQGKFQNLPTDPDNNTQVLYFAFILNGGSGVTNAIDFAAGFTAVTFNYALDGNSPTYDQTAEVWSGLNGTGTLLATIAMNSAAVTAPNSTRQLPYSTWSSATAMGFSGVAESVTFGNSQSSTPENMEIDAFTVPEPRSLDLGLVSFGALISLTVVRRRALRA